MDKFDSQATHPLQTSYWEKFRKAWGNEVVRVNGNLLTLHKVPVFNQKIAVFERGSQPNLETITSLKKFGKENHLIFIKLEPNILKDIKLTKQLSDWGLVPGKTLFTPSTFWIDLTKSEEELLKSFHPKTRYNIRLAQRKGVVVEEDNSNKAFEKFLKLYRETTQRQGFYAHNEKYFRLMWRELNLKIQNSKFKIARLLVAKYQGEILAAWILFVWNDVLYYPYGASTDKYKQVMAPNLMMWEAIRYGKKMGLKTFDLWGREPGRGFTRFKESYNPKVVEFIGTWDLPTSNLYKAYRVAENLRWRALRLKAKLVKPKF